LRKLFLHIGLPGIVVGLGYGPLLLASGAEPAALVLRAGLVLVTGGALGLVGLELGLNRTAAVLAALFWCGAPLTGRILAQGAPVMSPAPPLILTLAILLWRRGRLTLPVGPLAWTVLALVVSLALRWAMKIPSGLVSLGAIPGEILGMGARLAGVGVLPGASSAGVVLVGLGVWGLWSLLATHRYLMGKPLSCNLLLVATAWSMPLATGGVDPVWSGFSLVLFSLFLMDFLRPAKLVDSPRILFLAAFLMTLLARFAGMVLLAA